MLPVEDMAAPASQHPVVPAIRLSPEGDIGPTGSGSGSDADSHHRFLYAWRFLSLHLLHYLYAFLSIGFHVFFRERLCYHGDLAPNEYSATWSEALQVVVRFWKLAGFASAILSSGCLTLLQIEPIVNNSVARVLVISACIFSMTSLISCAMYLTFTDAISSPRTARRWVEASHASSPLHIQDTEFWPAVALPVSSSAWSFIIFMLALFTVAWSNEAPGVLQHLTSTTVIATTPALLSSAVSAAQVWRAIHSLVLVK